MSKYKIPFELDDEIQQRLQREIKLPTKNPARLRVSDALGAVRAAMAVAGYATSVENRSWRNYDRLGRYCEAIGARTVHDLAGVARQWIQAPNADGSEPKAATQSSRRWTLRTIFMTLRHLGVDCGDPTLDISVPKHRLTDIRPLTDQEIEQCRNWVTAGRSKVGCRGATWGLAELGGAPIEIGAAKVEDINRRKRTVTFRGCQRHEARTLAIDDWLWANIFKPRLKELAGQSESAHLAYSREGDEDHQSSTAANTLVAVFEGALGHRVSPRGTQSIRAWLGRREFERTSDIAHTARVLGLRSLDAAAMLIGWDWREEGATA